MKLSYTHVNSFVEVQERRPTFLAIGSFDGIHLGHQKLLHSMVNAAKTVDARTAVITFFPHPKRLLLNLQGPYYISTIQQRVETLANQGIDLIITQPFDDSIRLTRTVDFMEQLCQNLDLKQLWGGDFALGYKREGDVPTLRKIGEEKGYTVELVDTLVEWEGDRVSSSRIRRSLVNGEIEEVNGCLGRPYTVRGEVTMGDQRGRTIGFPTANLKVWPEQLLPANGVYATYAHVRGKTYTAATNIGIRPTIENNRLTIEAHLLDFDADLYDQTIELTFISRIRPEQKFSGLDALKAQIQVDIDAIRAKLIP